MEYGIWDMGLDMDWMTAWFVGASMARYIHCLFLSCWISLVLVGIVSKISYHGTYFVHLRLVCAGREKEALLSR
jgi:hypothetical protein